MAYLEFEIPVRSWDSNDREILIARMAHVGFEGFAEDQDLIQAYIPEEQFSDDRFNRLVDELGDGGIRVQYRFHVTEEQNWNEEWEKSFKPVVIGGEVLIRAPFHDPEKDLPCTLVIEPKMSFGTGHHHTTRLMIEGMMGLQLKGKTVLDMGCGTGVLGIFAVRMGARRVLAIDRDQWAYENALENAERNQARLLEVRLGDVSCLEGEMFDIILANITRNTLVQDIPAYHVHLKDGGTLMVSGILAEDVEYVFNAAYQAGLDHQGTMEASNWILLTFVKPMVNR